MSDDGTTTTTVTPPPTGANDGGEGDNGMVPRSRFIEQRTKMRQLETELNDLKTKETERANARKDALTKAEERAAAAEARAAELQSAIAQAQKQAMFSSQALAAGVRADAIPVAMRLVDLDTFSNETEAREAASVLLSQYAFLKGEAPPERVGTAGVGSAGTGNTRPGTRDGQPMLDDAGKPTEAYKQGFGAFLRDTVLGGGQTQATGGS